jgi:cytidylate kinase
MSRPPVICVDGPSGSGKGTLSRALALRLGWHFLDSGALYRLAALVAGRAGLEPDAPGAVKQAADLARSMRLRFVISASGEEIILLTDKDVTREIRSEACGNQASRYAQLPEIREALLARQRAFREPPGLVADGRDMGTVVFADAQLKFFVTASAAERARRRVSQLKAMGIDANIERIFSEIEARDQRDSTRQHSPLLPATDALILDTTSLSAEAVLQEALKAIRARGLA